MKYGSMPQHVCIGITTKENFLCTQPLFPSLKRDEKREKKNICYWGIWRVLRDGRPHIWHSYKRIFIFDCSAYFKIWGTESYWSPQLRRGSLKPIIGSAVHVGGEQNSACQPFLTALFFSFFKKTPLKSPQKMPRLFIPPPPLFRLTTLQQSYNYP